jgi:acyl carrier protein
MHDEIGSLIDQPGKAEPLAAGCARIFRDVANLKNSKTHHDWSDERLLHEPLDALQVDSLTLLEYVMAVEEAFNVELDEDDVNACENVDDLVKLVAAAKNGSKGL